MKKLIIMVGVAAVALSLHAQGIVNFANLGRGLNAPVTNAAGEKIPASARFVADLYFSTNLNAAPNPEHGDSFKAAGFKVGFPKVPAQAGYFFHGSMTVSGVPGGATILAQVRVWDATAGPTYEAARRARGQRGFSKPFLLTLGLPHALPPSMLGLRGFRLLAPGTPAPQ